MPMDDDRGRNNANVRGGSAAGQEARGGGSPGFGTGGGGSVGGGGGYGGNSPDRSTPGGDKGNDNRDRGRETAKEASDQKAREAAVAKAAEERRVREAQKAADDARAKATQEAIDKKAKEDAAKKEVADQKAREAAVAKAAEERRVREAAEKVASDKAAADKVVADQKAREAAFAASRDAAIAQKKLDEILDRTTGKIIGAENAKFDPFATNPNSSATGLGQFTKGTWLATVGKYRPDLMVGRTEAEVLGLRTDPAISVEMTRNLTKENATGLQASGYPVNESTLYLAHFLGLSGARKMLNAPADALASEVAGGAATTANQSILGGTKTAADVLRWASNKMDGAKSFDMASVTGTSPTSTTSTSPTRGITLGTVDNKADLPAPGANPAGGGIGVGGFGRMPPKPEPTSWYDKLVSVFDSTPQIEALEDQNRLAGGLTKEEYAKEFGVDPSKVQSRIVDYGQGQQVDYYTKSLGDVFGEAASDLGKGISNAGKGITSLFGGETSTVPTAEVYDKYGAAGDGSPIRGLGPGGDLTRDQYRDQYGGSDIATNLPPTGASTTTPPPVVPPVVPTEPVMPTVPNFAAAQQYIGTPTVATPGFNFSMPFAPRPPIDFANLGQAYAPTALASAPPQPLPGIPGAMYSTPYQRLG